MCELLWEFLMDILGPIPGIAIPMGIAIGVHAGSATRIFIGVPIECPW